MANAAKNIVVGAASAVSIGVYVEAAAAGSLAAVGYTKGPVTLEANWEGYEVKPEQILGATDLEPTGAAFKLKFVMMESTGENLRIALRQPSTQLTGVAPNSTLAIDDPVAGQYHQVEITGPAPRLTLGAARGDATITIWRAAVEATDAWSISKEVEQAIGVTCTCLYDDTVAAPTTKGHYLNIVYTNIV